jgi:hypothetical protein
MSKKIEGERLDVVFSRLRESDGVERPGVVAPPKAFISIGDSASVEERRAEEHDSLEADIVDFTIPRITEPSIFHAGRSISLLEHFLDELLPTLDESEELRVLAARVIGDEISRQRDILDRLQAGLAA